MESVLLQAERLYPTKNDLPAPVRRQLITRLNQHLANAVDLQTQAKTAHWNVKGPGFIALHKLFDEIHASVAEYVDLIAERAVQLGGIAEGTARIVARRSDLEEYPGGIAAGSRHVEALSAALAAFGSGIRSAIAEADGLGMPARPTSSRRSLAASTSGSGSWRRIPRRKCPDVLELRFGFAGLTAPAAPCSARPRQVFQTCVQG